MPTRRAYQRAELFAAEATELETSDARPAEFAASPGDWELASAAMPSPATTTSASGSSQMNRR